MVSFAASAQSTLGVEWELALIDATTGELVQRAPEVLARLEAEHPDLLQASSERAHITGEYLQNTLEVVTGVCTTVAQAMAQLRDIVTVLEPIIEDMGVELYAAGTHPFSLAKDQPLTDKERYYRVLDRSQYWGQQMVIYGVHVHVGVAAREHVLPLIDIFTNYCPHFIALSASSPFWEGVDTGYDSQRTMIYQQLPTNGLPFHFDSWDEYSDYLDSLVATGVISDSSEDRWDVRPVPRYGTIEMRYCDGMASLADISAIVALTQCLVHERVQRLKSGENFEPLAPWHAQENKWRAARFGLDAQIIVSNGTAPQQVSLRENLRELVEQLAPTARDLDCEMELKHVLSILERGNAAHRARQLAESGASLAEIALDCAAQTRTAPLR